MHTDMSLRQVEYHFGSFSKTRDALFPKEKDLAANHAIKEQKSYIGKLESQLGRRLNFEEELLAVVGRQIKSLNPVKYKGVKSQKKNQLRELVVMLNDTHYGLIVDKEELNNNNEFGWTQACRRTAMLIREAVTYKPHARKEVGKVHLVINGDIIAGIIHGTTTKGLELWVHQMNGALHILTHAIQTLVAEFPEVEVHGISGNHDDAIHKREHGKRAVSEKFDSYINATLYSLSVVFKNNPRVKFNIPKTPFMFLNLPGGRAMAAHGDTVFSKSLGNPGRSINVKGISDAIKSFNAGEIAKGKAPIKLVLLGHVHTYAHFITEDGVEVYIAPSLSGVDSYAQSLTINQNFIGQVVFESTKEFILGDSRLVRLQQADEDRTLDEIIPIYKNELSAK